MNICSLRPAVQMVLPVDPYRNPGIVPPWLRRDDVPRVLSGDAARGALLVAG